MRACNNLPTPVSVAASQTAIDPGPALQVFLNMQGKTGFRMELHRPSAPDVEQPYKVGSFALTAENSGPNSSSQAAWSDIELIESDGQRQLLTQALAQLFLPLSGQQLWPGQTSSEPPHQLKMYVNGLEVSQSSNIWSRVLQSGGQPSSKKPIKTAWDGQLLGSLQTMQLPRKWPAEEVAAASGIVYIMPNSDAVFNLQPEASAHSASSLAISASGVLLLLPLVTASHKASLTHRAHQPC